ncbi:MAG: type II toxin-antitoxin system death-on-curing family toxin [Cyclobacteriaceae bacterium]
MISVQEVIEIHYILIERFGGAKGIRDRGLLESAVRRPFQTFDGIELYPLPIEKAAAIFESIVCNHPFIDGNKRIAWVLLRLTLLNKSCDVRASENDKYEFVMNAASGKLNFEEIRLWIEQHVVSR